MIRVYIYIDVLLRPLPETCFYSAKEYVVNNYKDIIRNKYFGIQNYFYKKLEYFISNCEIEILNTLSISMMEIEEL